MTEWRKARCWHCGGHGLVEIFEGFIDCRTCGGSGMLWVSAKDRLADYPGGPLRGSAPGLFAETRP